MAAFNMFNSFPLALGTKVHNLNADTLKIMLTNVAPVASNTVKAHITEIAAGNGYPAGGVQVPNNDYFINGAQGILDGDAPVVTASGGAIPAFRYAVLYNDTALNDELIGWWDAGVSAGLNDGEAVTFSFPDGPGHILHVG